MIVRKSKILIIFISFVYSLAFWLGLYGFGVDFCVFYGIGAYIILGGGARLSHRILNNDVLLKKSTIKVLHRVAAKKKRKYTLNALSVDIRDKDTVIKSGAIVKSWFWDRIHQIYHGEKYSKLKSLKPVEVDLLRGLCLLYPVEVFLQVGSYDNHTFPYYAGDDEFSYRAKRNGFSLVVVPEAKAYLDMGQNRAASLMIKDRCLSILHSLFDETSSNNVRTNFKFTIDVVPLFSKLTCIIIAILKSIVVSFR